MAAKRRDFNAALRRTPLILPRSLAPLLLYPDDEHRLEALCFSFEHKSLPTADNNARELDVDAFTAEHAVQLFSTPTARLRALLLVHRPPPDYWMSSASRQAIVAALQCLPTDGERLAVLARLAAPTLYEHAYWSIAETLATDEARLAALAQWLEQSGTRLGLAGDYVEQIVVSFCPTRMVALLQAWYLLADHGQCFELRHLLAVPSDCLRWILLHCGGSPLPLFRASADTILATFADPLWRAQAARDLTSAVRERQEK